MQQIKKIIENPKHSHQRGKAIRNEGIFYGIRGE